MQMNDARISRITVIKLPEGWGSWKHQMIQIVEELPASWQLSAGVFLGGKLPEKKKKLSTELESFRHWGWCWHDYGSLILKVLRSSQLGYGYDLGWSLKPETAACAFEYSLCSPWNQTCDHEIWFHTSGSIRLHFVNLYPAFSNSRIHRLAGRETWVSWHSWLWLFKVWVMEVSQKVTDGEGVMQVRVADGFLT